MTQSFINPQIRCRKLQEGILDDLDLRELSPKGFLDWGKTLTQSYDKCLKKRLKTNSNHNEKIIEKLETLLYQFNYYLPVFMEDEAFTPSMKNTAYRILETYESTLSSQDEGVAELDVSKELVAMTDLSLGM